MEIASDNVVSLSVALCVSVHVSSSEELLLLLSTAPSPGSCRSNGHSDVSLRLPVSAVAAFIATARNSCLSRQPQLLLPARPAVEHYAAIDAAVSSLLNGTLSQANLSA